MVYLFQQLKFKIGVHQGGVLSPTNSLIMLTGYADDIIITATHTNYRTAEKILK